MFLLVKKKKNDLSKNARATREVNRYASHSRWVGYLTALVLLVALGMTGLWWWQNYQKSNEERDTLVQNYVSNTNAEGPQSAENTVSEPLDTTTIQPIQSAVSSSSTTPSVVNTHDSAGAINEKPAETAATAAIEQTENVLPKSMTSTDKMESETAVPDTQSAVENPTISPAPPAAQGDLVVEVLQNSSWLSVKDQNRKVLAQKEYKAGEVLTFNGNEFSLIVGAPGNVRITYKGENYPLKVDGRVAKFKLSQP